MVQKIVPDIGAWSSLAASPADGGLFPIADFPSPGNGPCDHATHDTSLTIHGTQKEMAQRS